MATKTKKQKVSMAFHRDTDDGLVTTFEAVGQGMDVNKQIFSNPPVDMATFKAQGATLTASVAAAKGGGRQAVAEKNKQKAIAIGMLSKQGRYVEEVAGGELTTLTLSGFQPRATPSGPLPLQQPTIEKLVQGESGQIRLSPSADPSARMFETRYGVVGSGGAEPTAWTTVQAPAARPPMVLNNLTPGTTYAFQVRAYGKLGWSAWSNSVMKMST